MTTEAAGTSPASTGRIDARTLHGAAARFAGGLTEVASGAYAWLQPNGDWSESNAGLIVGDGASALIDTTWDLRGTHRLLRDVAPVTAQAPIGHLLLTTPTATTSTAHSSSRRPSWSRLGPRCTSSSTRIRRRCSDRGSGPDSSRGSASARHDGSVPTCTG